MRRSRNLTTTTSTAAFPPSSGKANQGLLTRLSLTLKQQVTTIVDAIMGSDAMNKHDDSSAIMLQRRFPLIISFVSGFVLAAMLFRASPNNHNTSNGACQISLGTYKGPTYTTADTVGTPICLVESKFLKIQQHAVLQHNNNKDKSLQEEKDDASLIIPDWLFVDYHDQINVLVQAPGSGSELHRARTDEEEPAFYIFEQSKYALEGRSSKAVVGGLVEPGEDPADTARREVQEEMGLDCDEWIFLGRYRADVNRGAGWTSCFLARQCKHADSDEATASDETEETVGGRDTEKQERQTIGLSDLHEHVMEGEFLEIKWTATVALGLLHYF